MEKLSNLEIIQGDLKDLSPANEKKLWARIQTIGFDAPFFVWQNKILDGTQRKKVLDAMLKKGWKLPGGMVPVCDIEADNLDQAKNRLLGYISTYGRVTRMGWGSFVDGIEFPDLNTVTVPDEMNRELAAMKRESEDIDYREWNLTPYSRTHVLLSFPPTLFVDIQPLLEPILKLKGVTYEQESNEHGG